MLQQVPSVRQQNRTIAECIRSSRERMYGRSSRPDVSASSIVCKVCGMEVAMLQNRTPCQHGKDGEVCPGSEQQGLRTVMGDVITVAILPEEEDEDEEDTDTYEEEKP